jgi:hypothetical protein
MWEVAFHLLNELLIVPFDVRQTVLGAANSPSLKGQNSLNKDQIKPKVKMILEFGVPTIL